MFRGGWAGKILRVDLTRRKSVAKPLPKNLANDFIGGRGFTSKLLYDEIRPRTDPLGPDNRLFVAVGPCNGTIIPGSTRITIAAKSPVSGFVGDSNSGGTMGAELKYAGYDAVAIQGKAKKLSYLWIDDSNVELRPAEHLRDKTTGETRRAIESEIGDPEVRVASIGPAGDNLVKYACVISDVGRGHGRTGMGAVMGSKNLKAIVVRGSKGVKVAKPQALEKAMQKIHNIYHEYSDWLKYYNKFGTVGTIRIFQKKGGLPTKNYQTGIWDKAEELSPDIFVQTLTAGDRCCFSCPITCGRYWVIGKDPYKGVYTEGMSMMDMEHNGTRLGIANPNAVVKLHERTDELGIDIEDTSAALGWALECFEKGILTTDDTGGMKLEWGDYETFVRLMEMIARKEGFGALLAEGSKRASEIIGRGSEKYALHVKGLGIDSQDPRSSKGRALGYAVASRGAEHCRALFTGERSDIAQNILTEGKAERIAWFEDVRAVQNSLEVCEYCFRQEKMLEPRLLVKFHNAVTGSNVNEKELLTIGKRIVTVERAFNVREGLTRVDDNLPQRFLKEPMPEGPVKGQVVELDPMIDRYYEIRGWDKKTGVPRETTLRDLGLRDVAHELKSLGKLA
jgi:aldehyde:ferredoxin oxidoreductase